MTTNTHMMRALSGERTADMRRKAAAYRTATEARQAARAQAAQAQPARRQQRGQDTTQELIPANAEER